MELEKKRVPKTQLTGSQTFNRQIWNGQSCPSRRTVQTDTKRDMNLFKGKLTLFISVMKSKIRTRKMATGLSNMKIGLTSMETDSEKQGGGRSLIKMNCQVTMR